MVKKVTKEESSINLMYQEVLEDHRVLRSSSSNNHTLADTKTTKNHQRRPLPGAIQEPFSQKDQHCIGVDQPKACATSERLFCASQATKNSQNAILVGFCKRSEAEFESLD